MIKFKKQIDVLSEWGRWSNIRALSRWGESCPTPVVTGKARRLADSQNPLLQPNLEVGLPTSLA